jgi:integrase
MNRYNSSGIEPLFSGEKCYREIREAIPPALTTRDQALPAALLDEITEASKASRAESTRRSYQLAWRQFTSWCHAHARSPLPASPLTVQAWIIDLAKTIKVSTIQGRIAAIAHAHRLAGHSFDQRVMVGATLDGLKRQKGTAAKQARAIVLNDVREAVERLPNTIAGLRDRALILVGFMGALRRSEIVGLDCGSLGEGATGTVEIATDGVLVHLAKSKTDQEGVGQKIAIPRRRDDLCPARALEAWLNAAGIGDGPVFRFVTQAGVISASRLTAQSVRLIVKKRIGDCDTAHGLRSGFITEGHVEAPATAKS